MNAETPITWSHNALQNDLARYLRYERASDIRVVWENIQVGEGRPDCYSIAMSPGNPRPISYEVKVSRADFLSDVTSGKWQKYLPYSCGVVFATPKGLISKGEIPDKCGLIERSEAGWRFLKGPNLSRSPELPQHFLIGLLTYRADQIRREARSREWDNYTQVDRIRRALGADVARILQNKRGVEEKAAEMKSEASRLLAEAQRAHEQAVEKGNEQIERLRRELVGILKMPEGTRTETLVGRLREHVERLDRALAESAEVQRLQRLITDIDAAITKATDRPPLRPRSRWDSAREDWE